MDGLTWAWARRVSSAGILLATLALPSAALAQDISGVSLSVSPLRNEISIMPGTSYSGSLSVTNSAETPLTVYPLARDFTSSSDPASAAPQFSTSVPMDSATSLASWVTFAQPALTLPALGTEELDYTITLPKDAEAGGHYAAIFIATQNQGAPATGSVSILARIGSLLLLTVPGDIKVQGKVAGFTTDRRLYTKAGPADLSVTLANTGNIHFVPTGTVTVTNSLSGISRSFAVDTNGSSVLPDSRRLFSVTLSGLGYGRFVVSSQLVGVSPTGVRIALPGPTIVIWVEPVWGILIGLAAFMALGLLARLWIIRHDRKVLAASISGTHKPASP